MLLIRAGSARKQDGEAHLILINDNKLFWAGEMPYNTNFCPWAAITGQWWSLAIA